MYSLPDLLGYFVQDAVKILDKAGIAYRIVEIVAPGQESLPGAIRILKQHIEQDTLILTVCSIPGGAE